MRDHKLSSLGNLLGGALSRYGIGERVVAAQIVASANELLDELLPPGHRLEVQVVSFKLGELVLMCKSPTVKYVAEGMTKQLGRRLEERFPDQTFKKIVCIFKPFKATDDEWYNTEAV
ncbi:MAG: hypothetical protein WAZ14_03550 [Patescibacteria group bacterium]